MRLSGATIVGLACACTLALIGPAALSACGSKDATSSPGSSPAAASSPTAGSSVQPVSGSGSTSNERQITVAQWGLQFQVSNWMPLSSGLQSSGPDSGVVLYYSDTHGSSGGLLALVCEGNGGTLDVNQAMARLNDKTSVLGLLPDGVGEGGQLSVRRPPSTTTIGRAGWQGVSAEYVVTLEAGQEPLFGQTALGLEVIMFEHEGRTLELVEIAAPAQTFDAHRADLRLTAATLEPVAVVASPSPTPSQTPSPGQTVSQGDQAVNAAVVQGIRAIQAGVQAWAAGHGNLYPPPEIVVNGGLGTYMQTWPTDPLTNGPMEPTSRAGGYTYWMIDGGKSFKLIGYGVDGSAVITVP